MIGGVTRKTKTWNIPTPLPLNQGSEGACVGFGWAGELAVEPVELNVSQNFARSYYSGARKLDQVQGNNFDSGASVWAGAEYARQQSWISEYRWAFGINDVIDTLIAKGPVVLGINWYDGMYTTEPGGRVRVSGQLVGGHCILATGYCVDVQPWGGNWIQWVNSWGLTYGDKGVGYIKDTDLDRLLQEQGEACIATDINPTEKLPWWRRIVNTVKGIQVI